METDKKSASKPTAKAPPPAPAKPVVVVREEGPFSRGWYWFTALVCIVCLVVFWIYYDPKHQLWIKALYWSGTLLAIGLLIWAVGGLLREYQVVAKMGASAAARRRQREVAEGKETDDEVVYRENIVIRTFKFVGRLFALLFLFIWNTVLRIIYIIELTILRAILLAYDILYYTTYAAWSLCYWAFRIAGKIIRFALRVTWAVLRILTKLPIARGIWANRMRPSIMGKYNKRVETLGLRRAAYIDRKKRLAAARGHDPEVWYKDWQARHHFILPHPHDARKGLRERIQYRQKLDYNRRDRWRAYRRGEPIPPKLHIERPGREKKESRREKKLRKIQEKETKGGAKKASKGGAADGGEAAPTPDAR